MNPIAGTPDFSEYKLEKVSELEEFIKFDKERYLAFVARLNKAIDELPIGHTLKAVNFVKPQQYKIFVKICCWLCTVSHMNRTNPYYLEMTRIYDGITKKGRKLI